MEQNQSSLFNLTLDAQNSYTLRSVASWAKVLGIVSLITAGLCLVYGVIIQTQVNRYSGYGGYRSRSSDLDMIGNMGLVTMLIVAIIYALGGIFALNAGNKINTGLRTNNMETLNAGFAGARNFFALWAILLIISVLLILLGIVGSM